MRLLHVLLMILLVLAGAARATEDVAPGLRVFEINDHLVAFYAGRDPRLAQKLDPSRHDVLAQVHHAVEHELAATVDDVLVRRTQAFFRASDQGLAAAPVVAAELGRLLGLSEAERTRQVEAYRAEVERSRAFRREGVG